MRTCRTIVLIAITALAALVAACSGGSASVDPRPAGSGADTSSLTETTAVATRSTTGEPSKLDVSTVEADVRVAIDAGDPGEQISPLILGVSSTLIPDEMRAAGIRLNSWGGNPSTRYNYVNGHAWNHGADYEFRNTNYGDSGDAARGFLDTNAAGAVETRLAVPTLGWVAKNDDDATCSFPVDGGCLPAAEAGDCAEPDVTADPTTANIESTPQGVAAWIEGLVADGYDIRFVAMDNEPELWGFNHYDVHPSCSTYEEILDRYLTYADAVRVVAPDAELAGPVMCCWYDYWRIAPGPVDGSGQDFLEWFLTGVKAHEDRTGQRLLDVVDVHFYPQSGVFNDDVDDETNARRLRSTRALWDPGYADESWITGAIRFIPRMKDAIERTYPGMPLMISEWNFGAEENINGALAIAEVLGIYGREGVYAAAYWRNPDVGSPGFLAFTMHGNYDGAGARFGGAVVPAESSEPSQISSFAAIDDETGVLRVMLINNDPASSRSVGLDLVGFTPATTIRWFTYGPADLARIVSGTQAMTDPIHLPASSITVVELDSA